MKLGLSMQNFISQFHMVIYYLNIIGKWSIKVDETCKDKTQTHSMEFHMVLNVLKTVSANFILWNYSHLIPHKLFVVSPYELMWHH